LRDDPRWVSVRAELERASWLPLGSRMPPQEVQAVPKPARAGNGGGM